MLLQLVVMFLLLLGWYQMKRDRDSARHGLTVTAAVALNLLTVVLFMFPSYFGDDRSELASGWSFLLPVHHLVGLVAIIMMLATVLPWLLRKRSPRACPGGARHRRALMRATFGTFFLSIVLGFAVYLAML